MLWRAVLGLTRPKALTPQFGLRFRFDCEHCGARQTNPTVLAVTQTVGEENVASLMLKCGVEQCGREFGPRRIRVVLE